jgi:transposase
MGHSKPRKPKTEGATVGDPSASAEARFIDMAPEAVTALLERVDANMPLEDAMALRGIVAMVRCLSEEIKAKGASIGRLRAVAFGAPTELTRNLCPRKEGEEQEGRKSRGKKRPKDDDGEPKPGHGPKGTKAFPMAERIKVPHTVHQVGDCCPHCQEGHLYARKEPSVMLRIVAMSPISAKVLEREVLRCTECGDSFKAPLPAEVPSEAKYDESVPAMCGIMRFGTGMPYTRFSHFLQNLNVPLPTSTMCDLVMASAELLDPILMELIHWAAQGEVIHQDDTVMKILDRTDLIVPGKKDRKGIYTTGLISKIGEYRVALFLTGLQHAGENLSDLLKRRRSDLAKPIQMCDAIAANTAGDMLTILAHCLVHARRKFVEVLDDFPVECRFLLETLKVVYKNEAATERMSPTARLAYHQQKSGPVMKTLGEWLNKQIDDKLVEPNSGLGQAVRYTIKHWEALTLFLREPGAPLDNNAAERGLKRAIMHRKNSMFYKTGEGARVGDLYMSLIHTAELNGANPFDYLVSLMRNHAFVEENPDEWMPWNYKATMAGLEAQAQGQA